MAGCFLVYRPDVRQGNILTPQKVSQIKPGMSVAEVVNLLGYPVLVNVLAPDQMIYVYTIKPGHGRYQAQQLRIYISGGRVVNYTSSVHA